MPEICQRYGWDYYQYQEQPDTFIKLIKEKMKVEALLAKNKKPN